MTVGLLLVLAVLLVTLAVGGIVYMSVFEREPGDAENPDAGSPGASLQVTAPREAAPK